MTELLAQILPYKVLASHILLAFLVLAIVFRNSWGGEVCRIAGKYALPLALLVSLAAIVGSLFYSNVLGFEPCVLCWWQRVFLYPLVVIFAIALWKKDRSAFLYAVPLAVIAGLIALYQVYSNASGFSLLPCTALEGACSKVYVMAFGYITIPAMSLTVALYILLLAWVKKLYDKNSNA